MSYPMNQNLSALPCIGTFLAYDLFDEFHKAGFPTDSRPIWISGDRRLEYSLQLLLEIARHNRWIIIVSNSFSKEEIYKILYQQFISLKQLDGSFCQVSYKSIEEILLFISIIVVNVKLDDEESSFAHIDKCLSKIGDIKNKEGVIALIGQKNVDLESFGRKYSQARKTKDAPPISTILVDDNFTPSQKNSRKYLSMNNIHLNITKNNIYLRLPTNSYSYMVYYDPVTYLFTEKISERKYKKEKIYFQKATGDNIDLSSVEINNDSNKHIHFIESFRRAMWTLSNYSERAVFASIFMFGSWGYLKTMDFRRSKKKEVIVPSPGYFSAISKTKAQKSKKAKSFKPTISAMCRFQSKSANAISSALTQCEQKNILFKKIDSQKVMGFKQSDSKVQTPYDLTFLFTIPAIYEIPLCWSDTMTQEDADHYNIIREYLRLYYGLEYNNKHQQYEMNGGFSYDLSDKAKDLYLLILGKCKWRQEGEKEGFIVDLDYAEFASKMGITPKEMPNIKEELKKTHLIEPIANKPQCFLLLRPTKTRPTGNSKAAKKRDKKRNLSSYEKNFIQLNDKKVKVIKGVIRNVKELEDISRKETKLSQKLSKLSTSRSSKKKNANVTANSPTIPAEILEKLLEIEKTLNNLLPINDLIPT